MTNSNSSVEIAICSEIPSSERLYQVETNLPICNTNPSTGFCMVGDFFGGYFQTDSNFNSNINVNVKVNSYINISFNFSFSMLLKDLLVFRIMKLESTK